MNGQFFIRIRGKVQGPFDAERLRQLARRGQFSRLHEVSADGQSWRAAKDYPEIFAVVASPEPVAVAEPVAAPVASQPAASYGAPLPKEVWYYAYGGSPTGPVDSLRLSHMLTSGQISPDTSVWREGMGDWAPANTLPQFTFNGTAETRKFESNSEGEKKHLGDGVVRALEDSRGWVIFIAVMSFIHAAMTFGVGVFLLAIKAPIAAVGLSNLVTGCVIGFQGLLLISYATGIARFERSRTEESLMRALQTLKSFWVFWGILLIIALAAVIVWTILFIDVITSIPSRFS